MYKIFQLSFIAYLFSITLLLQACGGGSSSGGTTTNNNSNANSSIPAATGSVSTSFVKNSNTPRLFLLSSQTSTSTASATFVQESGGAFTTLSKYALSGSPHITQDIAGDADFAIGRWVWGTVTDTTSNTVLATLNASTSTSQAHWHYLVVNSLSALPASGSKTCDNGTFTLPSYKSGTLSGATGTTTGSNATLSFTASGANLGFTLTTSANGISGTDNYTANNLTLGTTLIQGSVPNASGAWIYLADGGNGTVRISGIYSTQLSNGAVYMGTYTFKCS